jgi:hypothetical protein
VIGADREAVFELHCPGGPVTLRELYRFALGELRAVMAQLNTILAELCGAWRRIHDLG